MRNKNLILKSKKCKHVSPMLANILLSNIHLKVIYESSYLYK